MPRNAWEQMVHGLELQTAVEEIEPLRAVDVHGRAQHALGEGLGDAEVCGRHGEVGEGDLDVHGHGYHVAEQNEGDAGAGCGDGLVDCEVAEPGPEEELAGDFEVAVPPCWAFARALAEEDVLPAEDVEVEAAEAEDGVVEVMLVWEDEFCEWVVSHDAVVVCRAKTLEEAMRDGEEGNMLDVWIVCWAVGYDVMDVVVTLPPAAAESAEEV